VLTRILTALILIIITTSVSAQRIDVTLKQDSARFSYISLIGGSTFGRTEMTTGVLYNEDGNNVVNVGLQVIDVAGSKTPGLEIGVGPRFYYLKHGDSDSSAASIALGGQLRYKLPRVQRMAIMGNAFYAPSITSTLDAENMYEISFGASYELLPSANVYILFRRIRANFTKGIGTKNIDNGGSVGMSFTF